MSRINATSDPLNDSMHAMNNRLISRPTSSFHKAVRNNTMISNDANSTLTPASKMDSRINRARR